MEVVNMEEARERLRIQRMSHEEKDFTTVLGKSFDEFSRRIHLTTSLLVSIAWYEALDLSLDQKLIVLHDKFGVFRYLMFRYWRFKKLQRKIKVTLRDNRKRLKSL